MTALVLYTNPQRAAHRYPTRSSSCTTEVTVSLITSFPQRKLLYFVFSLHQGINAILWKEQVWVPTMPGRCRGARGQAVLCSSAPQLQPRGLLDRQWLGWRVVRFSCAWSWTDPSLASAWVSDLLLKDVPWCRPHLGVPPLHLPPSPRICRGKRVLQAQQALCAMLQPHFRGD